MTLDAIAQLRAARYNASVLDIQRVHSDLAILRIKPDFPRPVYKAGQYCSLGLGYWEQRVEGCQEEHLKDGDQQKVVARAYSVSSSIESSPGVLRDMAADDYVEFYIVLVRTNADGRVPALTPRLFALKSGDRLKMFEKFTGHYTLDGVQDNDTVIFLGTGTGEAPHNAMLWELLRRHHAGRIIHACCVRYRQDLGYFATHTRLMSEYPHYTYLPLTTRENTGHGKVYIQDLITSGQLEDHLREKLDPARTHVFLCGNPAMIGIPEVDKATGMTMYPKPVGVIELLEARGFTADNPAAKVKGNLHFEKYW
jgi:ferredoxin/flavodoxin---NADP+ reductase